MTTLRPESRPIPERATIEPPPQRIELSIDSIALRGMPDPGPSGRRAIAQAAQAELVRLIAEDRTNSQAAYEADTIRGGNIFTASDPRRLGESIAKAIHRGLKRA